MIRRGLSRRVYGGIRVISMVRGMVHAVLFGLCIPTRRTLMNNSDNRGKLGGTVDVVIRLVYNVGR